MILSNAAVYYESAAAQQAFAAMTDSGDQLTFTATIKPWSQAPNYEYAVVPYGLATGGAISVGTGNDNVQTAALTAYMPAATGASSTTGLLSVNADTSVAVTRGVSSDTHCITSITVDTNGAIVSVAGTDGTAFTETRGAAGGPPLIPDGSIEIGQVRTTSVTAAPITANEIYQVVGTHQERYDHPVFSLEKPLEGKIIFAEALPTIHTGAIPKRVYVRCATPIFAEIPRARDWVPAETTNSVSSEQYYDGAIGSAAASLGQASFTVSLKDGVTDALLAKKGQNLIFKFTPDKNKAPYQLTQGILAVARTFGVGANPQASITVSPSQASVDFAS